MPEEVAIEAAIKGLRIGPFVAHLAREKLASMHEVYREFEKYCKSDNDYRKRLEEHNSQKKQVDERNSQKKNLSQDGRRPQRKAGGQMMNIEQPRNNKSGHNHPPAEPRNSERGSNQTGGGGQNRGWQKNQKQRQQKQYCFFHGEEKGHSTRDCPDAKETQERIKSRSAPQPPSSVVQPREVNHTFPQSFYHSYVRGSSQQHPALIQPSALAFAYYPGFLPAWRPAQPPTEQGQQPTYAPPRPPQITYIETAQPHQQSLPPPLNQL